MPNSALSFVWSILPRVEDPLPESIGFGFLVVLAGAGVVLADVLYAGSSPQRRGQAIRRGGQVGVSIGVAAYVTLLAAQLAYRG